MNNSVFFSIVLVSLVQACGPHSSSSETKAVWDDLNSPAIMEKGGTPFKGSYLNRWNELPLKAELKTVPWSDHYWPTAKGGLTYRWNDWSIKDEELLYSYPLEDADKIKTADTAKLSPLEKFDLFLGKTDFPYTVAERDRTRVLRTVASSPSYDSSYTIPSWEGLCHAWAPATLAFEEPGAVTLKSKKGLEIEFGSSDVKALLVYFLHSVKSPKAVMLGQRCEEDFAGLKTELDAGTLTQEDYDRRINDAPCIDTNAGSFHMVIANEIGRRNQGFVVDVTRDQEVWNQPVFAYETKVLEESQKASPGAAPGTVKEITVETTMKYIQEVTQQWDPGEAPEALAEKVYQYRLELDSHDGIIGGAWISDERPDFMWKRETPQFKGEFKAIEEIYKASLKAKATSTKRDQSAAH